MAAKLLYQGSAGVCGPCPQAQRALSGGGEWTQLRFSFLLVWNSGMFVLGHSWQAYQKSMSG